MLSLVRHSLPLFGVGGGFFLEGVLGCSLASWAFMLSHFSAPGSVSGDRLDRAFRLADPANRYIRRDVWPACCRRGGSNPPVSFSEFCDDVHSTPAALIGRLIETLGSVALRCYSHLSDGV